MLIDVVTDVRAVVGALEHDLTTLGQRMDQKVETLQMAASHFSGNDLEMMANGIGALKEWTGKASARVVYDSRVDPFTDDGLFNKVKGRTNIALVGFTTDGDVCGGFYSVAVTRQKDHFFDPNIFAFSFESHGRCMTPQRFAVKEGVKEKMNVRYWPKNLHGFVSIGWTGGFTLGNEATDAWCCRMSHEFEGLADTTMTGKNGTWREGPYHNCTRLVAFELS